MLDLYILCRVSTGIASNGISFAATKVSELGFLAFPRTMRGSRPILSPTPQTFLVRHIMPSQNRDTKWACPVEPCPPSEDGAQPAAEQDMRAAASSLCQIGVENDRSWRCCPAATPISARVRAVMQICLPLAEDAGPRPSLQVPRMRDRPSLSFVLSVNRVSFPCSLR